jgi:hypothetical protein
LSNVSWYVVLEIQRALTPVDDVDRFASEHNVGVLDDMGQCCGKLWCLQDLDERRQ